MKSLFCWMICAVVAHAAPAPAESAATEMATAAKSFLSSLDEAQTGKASFPFAAESREDWHYIPRDRKGLPVGDLTPEQLELCKQLLHSGMSENGVTKVETIISLESLLAEMEKNPTYRDPKKYAVTLFGDPTADGTWGWSFEGHHVSVNFTIVAGKSISCTPSFLGANPGIVKEGEMAGTQPLAKEENLARTLAATLQEAGKPVIYSEKAPAEILTGANRKVTQLEEVGISAADMTASQKRALLDLIGEYANRYRREVANKAMGRAREDLENLHFGWAGSLAPGEAYYYRIQGKRFLIEACNIQNNANHIHTVWRDFDGDFGRDVLAEHLKDEHPASE
ncbi:DUF3500 domain-containing protein [Luteolibacter pohnpeiensis]|uniref:DUF3500 domain-containing protein n=1 Tax=Luteolibacter pohnpeiensis TaxID=454153 RepID=A0A934S2S9_9BACT|nr:DUF3500 domain-containing protein [Luteolibacter pohnpeiensis]MBK1881396.1 DUF3500 domain-containing protein [Luteolibacter pohnpeiensis]